VDHLGDEATSADDRCTRTEYAPNTATGMLDKVKRTETVAVNCATTVVRPRDVIGDIRTYYDDADTYGAAPSQGLPVRVEELDSWNGTTPTYVTTSRTGYDALGRATSQSDALNRTTSTSFTPASTGPLTQTKVTNPAGHVTTTMLNPALGMPIKTVDANGGVAQMTYDGDGRLLAAWAPDRDRTTYPKDPSVSYAYQLRKNASTTVTTKILMPYGTATYRTTVDLFDGLLRARQTQTQTLAGGRTITENVYDSRGLLDWSSNPYYDIDNTAPNTTLVTAQGHLEIPALTQNVYDGAGRATGSLFIVGGDEKWRTTTAYAGEKTSTTPPTGGIATTTITDARNRLLELRQYKSPAQVGGDVATTFDKTTYGYTTRDQLSSVVGPGGNSWAYRYDLRGHAIAADDPDKGASTTSYDAAGQVISTKDARGKVLAYTYDKLGRKTTLRQTSQSGLKLAEWQYDTLTNGLGRLTKSIRYEYNSAGTASAYTKAVTSYDIAGQALGSSVTVPTTETGLCVSGATDPCTYSQGATYRNGAISQVKFPAVAGLAKETLTMPYNTIGLPDGLLGTQIYAQNIVYNQLDQLIAQDLGEHGSRVGLTYGFDEPTGRLQNFNAIPELKTDIYNLGYKYNNAGSVTAVSDTPDGGQAAETQCFTYDYLTRLTDAWTPTSQSCTAAPVKTALGGPAPYWRSYTFDASGNRKNETVHATTDTTRAYTYPAAAGAAGSKPHAVSQVATTVGTSAATTQKYVYDASGNTTCRPLSTTANTCPTSGTDAAGQALTWNDEDLLAKSTDKSGDTTFVYDADGNRMIRRDPLGTTLYLPGGTEVRKPKTGDAAATRYYSHAGSVIAVRTPTALTWMVNDHQGTGSATVNSSTLAVTRRRSLPFGADRGTAPATWVGDKGFVGGTKDNIGLTHLGAREYDPALGRFVSVDPVMDLAEPLQWNGYSYANDSPLTLSDPDGLEPRPWQDPDYDSSDCAHSSSWECHPGGQGGKGGHDGRSSGEAGSGGGNWNGPGSTPQQGVTVHYFYTMVTAPTWSIYTNGFLAAKKKWTKPNWAGSSPRMPRSECTSLDTSCQGADVLDVTYFAEVLCKQPGISCPGHKSPLTQVMGAAVAGGFMAGGERGGTARLGEGAVGALRLRAQLAGREISGGHAYEKHVVRRGEFPGIHTRSEFADVIEDVVANGEMRPLSSGRSAYWRGGVVVIRNPRAADGGTAFAPKDGYAYFLGLP
jgi:RHS repeat-associated protein